MTMADSAAHTLDSLLVLAWSMLAGAAADRRKSMHLVQAATIGIDGAPKVRTVVLRAANQQDRTIRFHTDCRSAKVTELAADPRMEIHAYDPGQNMQIRLSGNAMVHAEPDPLALAAWEGSRPMSRRCYRQEPGPGTTIDHGDAYGMAELDQSADIGIDRFRAIVLHVSVIEIVMLARDANRRARFEFGADGLSAKWLAP